MDKINDEYTACSIVEGFADFTPTPRQELEAWAYLIKTGAAWRLQGWYGRNARNLIEAGVIDENGLIDYQAIKAKGGKL